MMPRIKPNKTKTRFVHELGNLFILQVKHCSMIKLCFNKESFPEELKDLPFKFVSLII